MSCTQVGVQPSVGRTPNELSFALEDSLDGSWLHGGLKAAQGSVDTHADSGSAVSSTHTFHAAATASPRTRRALKPISQPQSPAASASAPASGRMPQQSGTGGGGGRGLLQAAGSLSSGLQAQSPHGAAADQAAQVASCHADDAPRAVALLAGVLDTGAPICFIYSC